MKKTTSKAWKLIAVVIAALIAVSAFAGCTGNNNGPKATEEATQDAGQATALPTDGQGTDATEQPTQAPTDAPTQAPTDAPAASIEGYYKLIGGKQGEEVITEEMIDAMNMLGLSCYLELNPDRTGTINIFGEESELTWDDKNITEVKENDPAAYTIEGNRLTLTAEETVLIFEKSEPPKTGETGTPEHIERAGYYKLSGGEEKGTPITPEMLESLELMGMPVFLVFEPAGTGFLNFMGNESELNWSDTGFMVEGELYQYKYENNTVTFSPETGITYIFTRSSEEAPERGEYADNGSTGEDDLLPSHPEDITFAGQTLVDNENVLITANRILVNEDYIPYGMEFTVTNRTGKNTTTSIEHALINGVDVDCMLFVSNEPGETVTDDTYLDIQDILACGGDDPSEIVLHVIVRDYDDLFADPIYSGVFTIYPMGEDKAGPKFERSAQANDIVIVDNELVTVTVYDFSVDEYESVDFGSAALKMYVVNKTDKELLLSFDSIEINGVKVDAFLWDSIYGSASRFTFAGWMTQELYSAGVKEEDINSFSFALEITDEASFETLKTENVSFTLK